MKIVPSTPLSRNKKTETVMKTQQTRIILMTRNDVNERQQTSTHVPGNTEVFSLLKHDVYKP